MEAVKFMLLEGVLLPPACSPKHQAASVPQTDFCLTIYGSCATLITYLMKHPSEIEEPFISPRQQTIMKIAFEFP